MKIVRFFIVATFTVLFSLSGNGFAAQSQMAEEATFGEAEALGFAQEWASLVGQADAAGLEKVLSEKYLHIHGTGLVENKKQFLEAFTSGVRRYEPVVLEEMTVRIFGATALVSGRFNLKATVRGKMLEGVNRFTLVLLKTEQGLQVISFQATALPPQPK